MTDTLTDTVGAVSEMGLTGDLTIELFAADGSLKQTQTVKNLVTTAGDNYYALMGAALVGTPNAAQPTKANGMKLGTATTAALKSGTGAASIAGGGYITASNVAFGSTYPQVVAVAGTDTGYYITYQTTWTAGVATNATINEVAIVVDQASNATSTAANTIARATISTVNKLAGDTLQITWSHKFLGA